jgi:sarcosine oxidase, subunit alpha
VTAGPYRLPRGGHIDRKTTLPFRFNGIAYSGHPGDTLASALLANGVRTIARSFKFHRPRGLFTCGIEEAHGLVQLGDGDRVIPSARAPMVELTPQLEARSQSGWPSLNLDVGRVLDFTAPLWAAGFYNKTFIWPRWHTYEGIIRSMAGLGRAPAEPDPDRYEVGNLHCDVLVVGAGSAGLAAAQDAARSGANVVLVDQDRELGGKAIWDGTTPPPSTNVTVLRRTTAVGFYDHNVLALVECAPARTAPRERYWIARAGRVVLATGAIEQPLIFDNNDRPGIMLASAARQYLRRYGVAVGRRVVVATNNNSAYAVAKDLIEAGVDVAALVDSRRSVSEAASELSSLRKIPVLSGSIPVDTAGFSALRRVTIGRLSADSTRIESTQDFDCDALAVSGGWNPTLHLFAQAGGKLAYDESSGSLHPVASHPSIEIVGSAGRWTPIGPRVAPGGKSGRKWVDLLHDVTVADIELAVRENYTSVEHVKRYTTVGMAADQGKTSAPASLDIIGKIRSVSPSTLGHTTLRPPFVPVTLGAIAGREIGELFSPRRLLPMHDWHKSNGAVFHDFSGWQRPVVYLRHNETHDARHLATLREARAVRTAAGLFDGSSLGKIEIRGPDALEFLDRFYINNLKTLQPGKARYGLMLRETGVIFDDGTVVALAPDHLLISTTSGNAGRVYAWLEEWRQCEWPELRVAVTPVTEQWATVSLTGPKARTILSRLQMDIDLSSAAFPHLGMREGNLLRSSGPTRAMVPTRIFRVSFSGELTYEINVPADAAPELWGALLTAGADQGLQPLGLDALLLLRLEKGFLHIGTDTDGTTVPDDVGWGKPAANKNTHYIGKRSLSLPENVKPDRLQLVGLKPARNSGTPFIIGSHLRFADTTHPTDGWITSAGTMALTAEPIALALARAGRQRVGKEVTVYDEGKPVTQAVIVNPPFYDPTGERMNA